MYFDMNYLPFVYGFLRTLFKEQEIWWPWRLENDFKTTYTIWEVTSTQVCMYFQKKTIGCNISNSEFVTSLKYSMLPAS